jgi:hypothetical protein
MPDLIARCACPFRPRRSGGPDLVWIAAIILTSTGFFRPGVRSNFGMTCQGCRPRTHRSLNESELNRSLAGRLRSSTPGRIVLARMVLDGVDDLRNAIAALAGTAAERRLSGKARPRPWKSC